MEGVEGQDKRGDKEGGARRGEGGTERLVG